MTAPRSQKAEIRPIGFLLQDLGNRSNDLSWVRFNIRPEELTVSEPSRVSVQQTLGGAWLDNAGPGVKVVTLSGTTGWRARYGEEDGHSLFKRLNKVVYADWHAKRNAAIEAGNNPDNIQLVLVDELDELVYVVAPMSFQLRRNKNRPLLMQYQILLNVIAETAEVDSSILLPPQSDEGSLDEIAIGPQKMTPEVPEPPKSVVDTLRDGVSKLQDFAEDIDEGIDKTIGAPVRAFMEATNEVLAVTTEVVDGIRGAVDTATSSLIETANNLSTAGRNIAHTIAAVENLPGQIKARFMEVGAAYSNAACVLSNAFDGGDGYPDYGSLYGASNCSSTSGGAPLSPLRDENPFYRVSPVSKPSPVTVSQEGQSAITSLAQLDVLSATPDEDFVARVNAASNGVSVESAA